MPCRGPSSRPTSITEHDAGDSEDGEDAVDRRDFLRAGSAVAVGGLLTAIVGAPSSGRTSPDVLDELRHRLVRLRKLDNTLGGGDTYTLYAAEAAVTEQLLRQSTNREPVHNTLLSLHAEQSQ